MTFELPVNIVIGRRRSSGATAERGTARDSKRKNTCHCAPTRQRAQLNLEAEKGEDPRAPRGKAPLIQGNS